MTWPIFRRNGGRCSGEGSLAEAAVEETEGAADFWDGGWCSVDVACDERNECGSEEAFGAPLCCHNVRTCDE